MTRSSSLSRPLGALNTLLLLTSSWFVVLGVQALREQLSQRAVTLFTAGLGCGVGFALVKVIEYGEKLRAGINPATNDFYMFYFVLTGIHFLHVLIGLGVLTWMGARSRGSIIRWRRNQVHRMRRHLLAHGRPALGRTVCAALSAPIGDPAMTRKSVVTAVWLLLVLATALSLRLGSDATVGPDVSTRLFAGVLLLVAFVKVRLIGHYFMELREAPSALRLAFDGWVIAVCGALILLYLLSPG